MELVKGVYAMQVNSTWREKTAAFAPIHTIPPNDLESKNPFKRPEKGFIKAYVDGDTLAQRAGPLLCCTEMKGDDETYIFNR